MRATIQEIEFLGLPAYALTSANGARAVITSLGAQVLSWQPAGGEERLYLSEKAVFDGRTAIRGGVPVCFPQFSGLGKLPKHGLVRTMNWTVRQRRTDDGFAMLVLGLTDDDQTRALWPMMFDAELTVVVDGARLDVELEIENTGHAPFAFTAALHTYIRVREVENARLEGLHGHEFRDATDADRIKRETGDVLIVDREVNRVYHDVARPLLLRDGNRSLGIDAEGFPDVVVWNPWQQNCANIADLPTLGFRNMLCVEAAAARRRVALDAGDAWVGRQSLVAI
ncbi:D-hexose-6-phosphate mutarotase [Rhodocyclaceae bacterium SMB388]